MIGGLAIASVAILGLITLTPTSPFWQEAVIIFFVGAGIGAAMPLMNIAIQNEFEQKDLGVATSSNQLFRGLGSTIGVAIFGSMLTLGIANNLGDMSRNDYVQTLKQSPAASQFLTDTNDANTLLSLNMPSVRDTVTSGFAQNLASIQAPAAVKQSLQEEFTAKQNAYSDKIVNAFTTSLHTIFIVTATMMAVALLLSLRLKERTLRTASPAETPGEI